jgi:hypothetical protein
MHDRGRVAQSVWRLTTGWMVRGPNPGGGEIFRTCPDRSWGPPSPLYNGYRVFLGGKAAGHDADHPPPSSVEVTKEDSYTSTPFWVFGACSEVNFTLPSLHDDWNRTHDRFLPNSRQLSFHLTS